VPLFTIYSQNSPDQRARFELADVHVSPTAFWFAQNAGAQIRPGLVIDRFYIYRDATLLSLIQAAYGVSGEMVSGRPSWLKSDQFDVVAKVPARAGMLSLIGGNTTLDGVANALQSNILDKPVVNQTGLTGRYDFALKFTPDPSQLANFGLGAPGTAADPDGPPIERPSETRPYCPLKKFAVLAPNGER
jgi:hypothetical protein